MKTPRALRTLTVRSLMVLGAVTLAAAVAGATAAITINARFLPGTESLMVQGTAPAGSQVLLTLTAAFDADVPVAVIDRLYVIADRDNNFSAVLPYAPASEHNAVLSVQASMDGTSPAIACCFPVRGPHTSSSPHPTWR